MTQTMPSLLSTKGDTIQTLPVITATMITMTTRKTIETLSISGAKISRINCLQSARTRATVDQLGSSSAAQHEEKLATT